MQRDQLADEERGERLLRIPRRLEHALLRADEAHLEPVARQFGQAGKEVGVRARVGDDEVGAPECSPVDRAKSSLGKRATPKSPAVLHERVRERDERVEDDRRPTRCPARSEQVEMSGVTDEDDVCLRPAPGEEAQLRAQEPRGGSGAERPLLLLSLPDRLVALDHLDAGAAKRGDHLCVPWVAALVGAEIEDTHAVLPRDWLVTHRLEDLVDVQLVGRPGPFLVVARDQLGEQPEREELEADDDE